MALFPLSVQFLRTAFSAPPPLMIAVLFDMVQSVIVPPRKPPPPVLPTLVALFPATMHRVRSQ